MSGVSSKIASMSKSRSKAKSNDHRIQVDTNRRYESELAIQVNKSNSGYESESAMGSNRKNSISHA